MHGDLIPELEMVDLDLRQMEDGDGWNVVEVDGMNLVVAVRENYLVPDTAER